MDCLRKNELSAKMIARYRVWEWTCALTHPITFLVTEIERPQHHPLTNFSSPTDYQQAHILFFLKGPSKASNISLNKRNCLEIYSLCYGSSMIYLRTIDNNSSFLFHIFSMRKRMHVYIFVCVCILVCSGRQNKNHRVCGLDNVNFFVFSHFWRLAGLTFQGQGFNI